MIGPAYPSSDSWLDDETGITWTSPPAYVYAKKLKERDTEIKRLRKALAEANCESLWAHFLRCIRE